MKRKGMWCMLICIFLLCIFPIQRGYAETENTETGWIEVTGEGDVDSTIRYVWMILKKDGITHVVELLPENNYISKQALEIGVYHVDEITVVSDGARYAAAGPDYISISSDKMNSISIQITKRPDISISSPVASPAAINNSNQNLIDSISENISTKPQSRLFTLIIFIILCFIMIYFKFRKENINE